MNTNHLDSGLNMSDKTHPHYRPEKKLRLEAENMLRDIAFVLQMTRRVKDQIVEEQAETVGA